MARIAREEISGFAGFYVLGDSAVVVRLTSAAERVRAKEFGAVQASRMRLRGNRVEVATTARYDFALLKSWFDLLSERIPARDKYLLDVDELANRIVVGLPDGAAVNAMREVAASLGIPADAIDLRVFPAPQRRSGTLRDPAPGRAGGLQIYHPDKGVCTLGFNVRIGSSDGFMTNSHCTLVKYGLDATSFFQPDSGYPPRVGQEAIDPSRGWFTFSDASFISYFPGASFEPGRIMQTLYPTGGQDGPITIYQPQPFFDIAWKWNSLGDAPVGTVVHKVGRTSGWTAGTVTASCVFILELACQWVSDIWSRQGDSGSPIFQPSAAEWPKAALIGILWGGPEGVWNTTYHSSIWGIEADFGVTLGVTRPAPPPGIPPLSVAIVGNASIISGLPCQWSAVVTGGATPYTYAWAVNNQVASSESEILPYTNSGVSFTIQITVRDSYESAAFSSLPVSIDGSSYCQ